MLLGEGFKTICPKERLIDWPSTVILQLMNLALQEGDYGKARLWGAAGTYLSSICLQ